MSHLTTEGVHKPPAGKTHTHTHTHTRTHPVVFCPPGRFPFSPTYYGLLFSRDLFLSFFVSLSAKLRENGWTDLHEIFREGVECAWDDLIKFWVNSGKRVAGSKVNLFVITGQSSSQYHSLGGSRGRGLLCLAPQLVLSCADTLS